MNDSEVVANNRYSNSFGSCRSTGSEIFIERKLRTRRRCQQPKTLNSPEDSMYYNHINGTLDYQGSKRKPRKLGQVKVLDREDEYYKLLSTDSIPEEDLSVCSPLAQQEVFFASS
ncbi:unnamed protein product [Staurois parvus]|uniref:Uncharacterized protein n=1 Tax=Staurois parvus TaxID=386267 RepID=A0ABN9CK22_9NEOB|nr:unnamed protein product [Staurois parvus]